MASCAELHAPDSVSRGMVRLNSPAATANGGTASRNQVIPIVEAIGRPDELWLSLGVFGSLLQNSGLRLYAAAGGGDMQAREDCVNAYP